MAPEEETNGTAGTATTIQQESLAMTPEEDAKEIASDIKAYAATRLRARYAYLNSDVLSQMVDNIASEIKTTLVQQHNAMEASKSRTGLFTIPPELRNRIYELLLIKPSAVRISKPPALLQVNRQIRQEAAPVYYGQNSFHVGLFRSTTYDCENIPQLQIWLKALGKQQQKMIKEILISLEGRFDADKFWLKKKGRKYLRPVCMFIDDSVWSSEKIFHRGEVEAEKFRIVKSVR